MAEIIGAESRGSQGGRRSFTPKQSGRFCPAILRPSHPPTPNTPTSRQPPSTVHHPVHSQAVRRRSHQTYHEGVLLKQHQSPLKNGRANTVSTQTCNQPVQTRDKLVIEVDQLTFACLSPRIDPSIRLRRAIHVNDNLLVKRILRSHPHLLHNPDHSITGNANSNLHLAASLGHLSICKILVELGHEEGTPALNDEHQTALMLAAAAGHTEVVHFLCENDPQSILRQDIRGRDAVMEASSNGHDTVVQILLTWAPGGAPAALAQADLDGNTALHFASGNGNLLVLRTLLAAGADPGRKNIWSWTPGEYSATVQAEVYLKGLVNEVQKRKTAKREAEETQAAPPPLSKKDKVKGAFVRLVGRDVDVGD